MLSKCEDRFQAELDVNTILKKLRYSSAAFTQFNDKDVKQYFKLHKSITVKDSSSEEEDEFEENVANGFFSSDEDNEENEDKKEDGEQNTIDDEKITTQDPG